MVALCSFYQHLPTGCDWDWGLVWGHAVSSDLVHWQHLPPALRPTPGRLDADGCFSGCCTVDEKGIPTILYTGVRLRSNQDCGPLPPAECDLQLPFIESQLLARGDPGDPSLITWSKQEAPFLPLPPADLPLTGWRDPFVIQMGGRDKDWIILMGAGLKNEGGTSLIYRARSLSSTWEYSGLLCLGDPSLGAMWECPLLWEIPEAPKNCPSPSAACGTMSGASTVARDAASSMGTQRSAWHSVGGTREASGGAVDSTDDREVNFLWEAEQGDHIFAPEASSSPAEVPLQRAVSSSNRLGSAQDDPYTHFFCISPDAPTNAVLYWMGKYDPETVNFRLAEAVGPFRLDMGDTIYAPNIFEDAKGRCVLWAWVQERRSVGKYDFSGCMATPRVLLKRNGHLLQQPLPEIAQLRKEESAVEWPYTQLVPNTRVSLDGVSGSCLDIELVFERSTALISGVTFQSWTSTQGSAAVFYDWQSSQLEVVFEGYDPDTKSFSLSAPTARRIGGYLEPQGLKALPLRIILDSSLLEVFCGTGQVITTRVYRGVPPSPKHTGIDLLSIGGTTGVSRLKAWELSSIWSTPQVTRKSKVSAFAAMSGKFEQLSVSTAPNLNGTVPSPVLETAHESSPKVHSPSYELAFEPGVMATETDLPPISEFHESQAGDLGMGSFDLGPLGAHSPTQHGPMDPQAVAAI